MALKTIFITTTGAGSFTIPADWTSVNSIHVLGAGAGGKTGAAAASGGGGAGQYRTLTNITKTPGASITISVGAAGGAGANGGNTWWDGASFNTGTVNAQGGQTTATGTGGVGGSTGTGGAGNNGGAGGVGPAGTSGGGAGGGAAGPGGVGGLGGDGRTGGGGNDFGGSGGGGAGSSAAGGAGGIGTTSAGAVGTGGATGGGDGGAGGQGSGVAPSTSSPAPYLWTSTHATDGITPSVATARPGGGAGGGGSAAASAGGAANAAGQYGGGGGGANNGTAGQGANGIIVVTYETESRIDSWGQPPNQPDLRKISVAKSMAVVAMAAGLFAPLPVPSRAVVSWAEITGIAGGSAAAPETVTVDKWQRPLSEPVLRKGLTTAVAASSGSTAPVFTSSTIKVDWHAPLSTPVLRTGLNTVLQAVATGDVVPELTPSNIKIDWHRPLAEPVKGRSLATASHPSSFWSGFTPAAAAEIVTLDKYFIAFAEPVRFRLSLAANAQQTLAWGTFTPALSHGWFRALETPPRGAISLATQQQVAVVWSGFTPPPSFGWYRSLTEPPKRLHLPTHAQIAFSWSGHTPAATPAGVGTGLASVVGSPPPQVKTFLYPSLQQPVPVVAASSETVTLDKWFSALAQPSRKRGPLAGSQQAATFVVPWLSAPVLTWTGDQTDNTPDFDIEFDESADEGAVITLQIDDDINFGSPATYTDTLDAGEVAAGEVILATADLAAGTYYARARVTDGGIDSAWSNTETVTIIAAVSSWSAPLSSPVRTKPFAAQQNAAWTSPVFVPALSTAWHRPQNEPPKPRFSLATAQQNAFFWSGFTPASTEVVTLDKWFLAFTDPVRIRPGLATQVQQTVAFVKAAPFPEVVTWDRWGQSLSQPILRTVLGTAQSQPALAWSGFTPGRTDWFVPLSEPLRPRLSLPTGQQQTLAWSGFTPASTEVVTVDKWFAPLAEPVRLRLSLATDKQQAFAWSGFTPSLSFGWFAPLNDPPKLRRSLLASQQQTLAWGAFTPPPSYGWFAPLATPPKKNFLPVAQQRLFAWSGFTPAVVIEPNKGQLDKWYRPLNQPVWVRRSIPTADQQYLAFVKAEPFEGSTIADDLSILTNDKRILVFALEMYPGPSPDRVA